MIKKLKEYFSLWKADIIREFEAHSVKITIMKHEGHYRITIYDLKYLMYWQRTHIHFNSAAECHAYINAHYMEITGCLE